MSVFSAIALLAVIWFMTLFVVLPIRMKTQAEAGTTVRGTPQSAPENPQLKRKFLITSTVALPIWGVITYIILSGWITVDDFDLFTRFGGPSR